MQSEKYMAPNITAWSIWNLYKNCFFVIFDVWKDCFELQKYFSEELFAHVTCLKGIKIRW